MRMVSRSVAAWILSQGKGERDRLGRTRRPPADGIRALYHSPFGDALPLLVNVWFGSRRASNSVGGGFHGEKARADITPWLTWTALDVGGLCVEAFYLTILNNRAAAPKVSWRSETRVGAGSSAKPDSWRRSFWSRESGNRSVVKTRGTHFCFIQSPGHVCPGAHRQLFRYSRRNLRAMRTWGKQAIGQ
jgi:hypothetical protein